MRKLSFEFNTRIDFSNPVKEHSFLLRYIPMSLPQQRLLRFRLNAEPLETMGSFSTDSFGNSTYSGRIGAEHTSFSYGITGILERDDSCFIPEQPAPFYRYPSFLTHPSAELIAFANEISHMSTDLETAGAIADAVFGHFEYVPGSTSTATTAAQAFSLKKGVCQDYAHVFITVARLLNIPARYVCGLPLGDGSSHAWAEIWYDGRWYGFDPTRDRTADEGYIKLSVGRDFNDCSIERGHFLGACQQHQTSFMKVMEQ